MREQIQQQTEEELQKLRDQITSDAEKLNEVSEQLEKTKEEYAEHRRKAQRLIMEKEMNLDKFKQRLTETEEAKSPD